MAFYIILIFIQGIILFIGNNKKSRSIKNTCLFFSFFFLFFVAAFRFDVGYDYENYYNYIEKEWLWGIIRMEPLNQPIFHTAIFLKSPLFAFIIYAILTYYFIIQSFKRSSINPFLSIFIYILLFYIESLCYMRQGLAIAITLYAYPYIKEKKNKQLILWGGIATCFHFAAIVIFIIYFIYHYINIFKVILFSILAIVAKSLIFASLQKLNLYSSYFDKAEIGGGSMIRLFFILLVTVLYFFKKKKNIEEKNMFAVIIFGLHLPFLFGSHLGMRVANFFFIYLCLLIPLYLKRTSSKIVFSLLFISYFTLFMYTTSISNKSQYIPYHFYWNKDNVKFRSQYL